MEPLTEYEMQHRFKAVLARARKKRQEINQRSVEWKTQQANQFAKELEERPKDVTAEDSGVLTAELRREANALYECGLTVAEVADQLRVSSTTAWKAIAERRPTNALRRKLCSAEVLELRNLYIGGKYDISDLAKQYEMSRSAIWRVITGQTYKELA